MDLRYGVFLCGGGKASNEHECDCLTAVMDRLHTENASKQCQVFWKSTQVECFSGFQKTTGKSARLHASAERPSIS